MNDDTTKRFMITSLSNITATSIVYPLDTIRVSKHLNNKIQYNPYFLYKGYSAGILRQMSYSTPNVFLYSSLLSHYKDKYSHEPSLFYKTSFGIISGSIAGFIGTPAELIMIKGITDKNYKGILPTVNNIVKKEGFVSLFKGCGPTILRAALYNGTRLPIYSQSKIYITEQYPSLQNTVYLHGICAFIASSVGNLLSNPYDVIKSKMQSSNKSFVTVFNEIQQKGIKGFYKGFIPNLFKSAPHAIISFITLEKLSYYILKKEIL